MTLKGVEVASKKKIFRVFVEVELVTGWQAFDVHASSEEEAIKVFEESGGEYAQEELEVQNLGKADRAEEVTDGSSPLKDESA